MKKYFFYLSLMLVLSSCSLMAIGPNAYVESPENIHSQSGRSEIYARAEPAQHFYMSDNAAARPLVAVANPQLRNAGMIAPGMNYVLSERIEVGATVNPVLNLLFWRGFSFIVRPSIKYQILGDTGEKTKSVGSRLALFANTTWTHLTESGDQRDILSEGGYPWSTSSDFTGLSGGFSYGYRFNSSWLFYGGLAHQIFEVNGKINQSVSKTGDFPSAEYKFAKTAGHSSTITVGSYAGVNRRFHIFYSYSVNEWAAQNSWQHYLGIGFSSLSFFKDPPTLEPNRVE